MEYTLNKLSSKQLGELFPIEIVPYDSNWPKIFKKESLLIKKTLGNHIAHRIEHFGSTAIEGLSAKPTIDILVEIPPLSDDLKTTIIQKMNLIDYQFIWRTDEEIPYMNFVKGYTNKGYRKNVFHIHMGDKNHPLWDRLYFRDYLMQNKNVALEYEKLKIRLAIKYKHERELYTKGKTQFVKRITKMAKKIVDEQNNFANQLDGGDLRSIGSANKVVQEVENQNSFDILFKELFNSERKIVMRAADVIEKITLKNPNYLLKHKIQIISLLKTAKHKELKWHLALLISRIKLTDEELGIVWQILSNWIADKNESKIVRVNSIQGLYNLLPQKQELQQDFELTLNELKKENIPSINARIKRLRKNSRY